MSLDVSSVMLNWGVVNFTKFIRIIFLAGGIVACSATNSFGSEDVFQSFDFQVAGGGIHSPQVMYGDVELITAHQQSFEPNKKGHATEFYYKALAIPIPDFAMIRWKSADGQWHTAKVLIRTEMRDVAVFVGFDFVFIDDSVEVYLRERKRSKVPSPYIDVVRTKIFPKV